MIIYAIGTPANPPRVFYHAASQAMATKQLQAGEVAIPTDTMADFTISPDGLSLVPIVPTLDQLKAAKWIAARQYRDQFIAGGCSTPAGRVQTDQASYQRIIGAMNAAQTMPAYSVRWTMADNSTVLLEAPAMIAMANAVTTFLSACQTASQTVRAAINAATDADAVAAIDVAAGYPSADA